MIEVTAAILHRDGKILICQRPDDKSCGGLWEFPGGKQEPGESLEDCLKRECQEELGIQIGDLRPFSDVCLEDRNLHLHFFQCRQTGGQLERKEHPAFAWITPDEIDQYTFCPSDTKMLEEADRQALFADPLKNNR